MDQPSPLKSVNGRSGWWIWIQLVVVSSGMFLVALDVTVNVSLPAISNYFTAEPRIVYLMITFYLGTTIGLQLGMGGAGDTFGLRRIFLVGLVAYTVAMVAISFSPTINSVIGFRVVQAFGNASLAAIAPALVTSMFPREIRGRALGIMTGIGTLGMILGTVSAGALLEIVSWRWIFLFRIPFCIAAIAGTLFFLRGVGDKVEEGRVFDWIGASLVFAAMTVVVLFLNIGALIGWVRIEPVLILLVGAFIWVIFIRRQKVFKPPLIDLKVLNNKVVTGALVANLCMFMSTFVNVFILPYFVSEIMGASTTSLAVLLLVNSLALALCAPLGGYLSDRISPGPVTIVGTILIVLGLLSYQTVAIGVSVMALAVRMAIIGAGMGLFQSANLNLVMTGAGKTSLGTGGALSSITRGIGNVVAVAVLGGLFTGAYTSKNHGVDILLASTTTDSVVAYLAAFKLVYFAAAAIAFGAMIASVIAWRRG